VLPSDALVSRKIPDIPENPIHSTIFTYKQLIMLPDYYRVA